MAAMEEDVQDQGGFDLETYISNYTGHAKVDRLMFIADRSIGRPLELEALRMAHDELKKTDNTQRYQEVVARIDGRLGPTYTLDRSWVESVDRRSQQRGERLESELQGYKVALMKESIRMGHQDLGDWAYERGDLQMAFKCYVRTRDYCTTSRHVLSMCLAVIRTALELRNYVHVSNYVAKAEQTPDVAGDAAAMAKLRAASGLVLLHSKKYKQAARKFCEVSPELGSHFNDVLAAQDVALYGGLCALASLDRSELKSRVLANIGFRELLETAPEVRELIHAFYNSQYAQALARMDALRPQLALDVHLSEHASALYASIRHRALCQYVQPFSSVNLNTMAQAFSTAVGDLERELASLIMDGAISARIDSATKVLYARTSDARATTFSRVMTVGETFCRDTRALLLRANLLQHDFVQVPPGSGAGWGGGPGGGRGKKGDRGGGTYDRMGGLGGLLSGFAEAEDFRGGGGFYGAGGSRGSGGFGAGPRGML